MRLSNEDAFRCAQLLSEVRQAAAKAHEAAEKAWHAGDIAEARRLCRATWAAATRADLELGNLEEATRQEAHRKLIAERIA